MVGEGEVEEAGSLDLAPVVQYITVQYSTVQYSTAQYISDD